MLESSYRKRVIFFIDLFVFSFVCVIFFYSIVVPKDIPKACKGWNIRTFLFIIELIFYSSIEEFLYRIYFLEHLNMFLDRINTKAKNLNIFVANFTSHILFAVAHIYLGLMNVVFAFLMAILFRFLYVMIKKAYGNIASFIFITILHSSYNIFAIFFIF